MAGTAPLSPGSPYNPNYPFSTDVEEDLTTARQAQHITDPAVPLVGFTNGLAGYGNACFRNAVVSLLANTHPIPGFIVANARGQLDGSPTAHLLEKVIREYFSAAAAGKQARLDIAIQRLYNRVNYRKPVVPSQLTRRYAANTQQDAMEFLNFVLEDILQEYPSVTSGQSVRNSFTALFQTTVAAVTQCNVCGRRTNLRGQDEQSWASLKASLTAGTTTFDDLIERAFSESPTHIRCARCKAISPRLTAWRILKPSEVIFIDIDQVQNFGVKPGQNVPDIPEILNLDSYLHELAVVNELTARYRLVGIVNHQGSTANSGHYVSHVLDLSGNWRLIDDANVSPSSLANAQKYVHRLKANQMIPRLLAYVRVHDEEDENALATRVKTSDVASKPLIHEQIAYDDTMTLKALRDLCREKKLPTNNTKTPVSLRTLIDKANSMQSTFATRPKEWLINTLTNFGERVNPADTRSQLAGQLKTFMASQSTPVAPVLPKPAPGPQPGRGGPPAGNDPAAPTQAALDTAKARIVELEQTIANLQRNTTTNTGTSPRSPRAVTTDQIRELIRRLPPSSSPPRGTKRVAEDPAQYSFEREKRRAIRLADQACVAIDAGAQLAPARSPTGDRRPSDTENQRPRCSPIGSRVSGSPESDANLRCHRCPIIENEIHHMHANVCGWRPETRVSSLTQSEIDDDLRQIKGQRNTNDTPDDGEGCEEEEEGEEGGGEEEEQEEEEEEGLLNNHTLSTNCTFRAAQNGNGNGNSNGGASNPVISRSSPDDNSGIILEDGDISRSVLNEGAQPQPQIPRQTQRSSRSRSIPSTGSRTRSYLGRESPRTRPRVSGSPGSQRETTEFNRLSPGLQRRSIQDLLARLKASYET